MKLINTLPNHLAHPEVPYSEHVNLKRLALGESITSSTKLYLDTKFWVDLRNVMLGRNNDAGLQSLLALLTRLVGSGRVICPLGEEIIREIFHQSDVTTLSASTALIDRLSHGICLLDQSSRIGVETLHFVRGSTRGVDNLHPLKHLVWTKAAFFLGHVTPVFRDEQMKSQGLDAALQKAFFDQMWQMTLSDFLDVSNGAFRLSERSDISELLNDGKFANLQDNTSLRPVFDRS
jgi:hypothetical protein